MGPARRGLAQSPAGTTSRRAPILTMTSILRRYYPNQTRIMLCCHAYAAVNLHLVVIGGCFGADANGIPEPAGVRFLGVANEVPSVLDGRHPSTGESRWSAGLVRDRRGQAARRPKRIRAPMEGDPCRQLA